MKEPKQKSKMQKPKILEKPGTAARDARSILTGYYRAQERQAGSAGQQEEVFFSGEDKSADVTSISSVVQEVNAEFNQRIEDIKTANSYVDSVEIHYSGSADNIRVDNWMDVIAVFAVMTATDTEKAWMLWPSTDPH